jgi:hypothetical protein
MGSEAVVRVDDLIWQETSQWPLGPFLCPLHTLTESHRDLMTLSSTLYLGVCVWRSVAVYDKRWKSGPNGLQNLYSSVR